MLWNDSIPDVYKRQTVECGTTIDVETLHEMEKVLFAADELTGLIWAAALMRCV